MVSDPDCRFGVYGLCRVAQRAVAIGWTVGTFWRLAKKLGISAVALVEKMALTNKVFFFELWDDDSFFVAIFVFDFGPMLLAIAGQMCRTCA